MTRTAARRRALSAFVAVLGGLSVVVAAPAGAGAPPPPDPTVVTIAVDSVPSDQGSVDCQGVTQRQYPEGAVLLERTGPLLGALTVGLAAGGDLAGEVEDLPATATFPAGAATVTVGFRLPAPRAGTLLVEVAPGPGYTVGPAGTAAVAVEEVEVVADCRRVVALPAGQAQQTIRVGERPTDFDLGGGSPWVVVGALPPGLTLSTSGAWAGAATTAGTFPFEIRYCASWDGSVCVGHTPVAITVLAAGSEAPPAAAPAAPVPADARFTG